MYRDDQRLTLCERTELSSNPAEVRVDAPVMSRKWSSEHALGHNPKTPTSEAKAVTRK